MDILRYHNLFDVGRIKLRELLTDRLDLEDINIAIDNMRSGKAAGRCLIQM